MLRAILELTLRDDVVVSERGATEGGHRGLDYLPGAQLLGAAAAKLYSALEAEESFVAFHSGRVRFGNALPVSVDGATCFPVPLSWHGIKDGDTTEKQGRIVGESVWNGCDHPKLAGRQTKQLRGGYVATETGEVVRPALTLRMKTAVDPDTGRAARGQLFGYQSIARGTRFRAVLAADDSVGRELFDRLREALTGRLLLGRSRSAQYGEVWCEASDCPSAPSVFERLLGESRCSLWLLSDLAARDAHGQATLFPDPRWLGLPCGVLDNTRSFIRTRSYSPYNGYRRCYDTERQVLVAGSVLHFEFESPLREEHLEILASGIGDFRESGLGVVHADRLLAETHPRFKESKARPSDSHWKKPDDDPLIAWLVPRPEAEGGKRIEHWLAGALLELRAIYDAGRAFAGTPSKASFGPTRSQWGRVLEAAKAASNRSELNERLFVGKESICKLESAVSGENLTPDEDWSLRSRPKEEAVVVTFASWLKQRCNDSEISGNEPRAIALLARESQARNFAKGDGE